MASDPKALDSDLLPTFQPEVPSSVPTSSSTNTVPTLTTNLPTTSSTMSSTTSSTMSLTTSSTSSSTTSSGFSSTTSPVTLTTTTNVSPATTSSSRPLTSMAPPTLPSPASSLGTEAPGTSARGVSHNHPENRTTIFLETLSCCACGQNPLVAECVSTTLDQDEQQQLKVLRESDGKTRETFFAGCPPVPADMFNRSLRAQDGIEKKAQALAAIAKMNSAFKYSGVGHLRQGEDGQEYSLRRQYAAQEGDDLAEYEFLDIATQTEEFGVLDTITGSKISPSVQHTSCLDCVLLKKENEALRQFASQRAMECVLFKKRLALRISADYEYMKQVMHKDEDLDGSSKEAELLLDQLVAKTTVGDVDESRSCSSGSTSSSDGEPPQKLKRMFTRAIIANSPFVIDEKITSASGTVADHSYDPKRPSMLLPSRKVNLPSLGRVSKQHEDYHVCLGCGYTVLKNASSKHVARNMPCFGQIRMEADWLQVWTKEDEAMFIATVDQVDLELKLKANAKRFKASHNQAAKNLLISDRSNGRQFVLE